MVLNWRLSIRSVNWNVKNEWYLWKYMEQITYEGLWKMDKEELIDWILEHHTVLMGTCTICSHESYTCTYDDCDKCGQSCCDKCGKMRYHSSNSAMYGYEEWTEFLCPTCYKKIDEKEFIRHSIVDNS